MQIHDLARNGEGFDLVLFLGVFYHLRYPMLALDSIAPLVRKLLFFQTLTSDPLGQAPDVLRPSEDYPITERSMFLDPGWPRLSFIEKRYSGDRTNWWAPNHAAVEALLRSTGFQQVER